MIPCQSQQFGLMQQKERENIRDREKCGKMWKITNPPSCDLPDHHSCSPSWKKICRLE
jgi:hypothetical protein